MKIDLRRVAQGTNFAAVAILAVAGVFLVTLPLHPQVDDSHGGLMAVFPGALLLLFALLIYAAGNFLSRRENWGWQVQILVAVVVVVAVTILALA
jgi:hypothetical protein